MIGTRSVVEAVFDENSESMIPKKVQINPILQNERSKQKNIVEFGIYLSGLDFHLSSEICHRINLSVFGQSIVQSKPATITFFVDAEYFRILK